MERVQFIKHRGKQILHLNFANARPEEVLDAIGKARSVIGAQPPLSVRVLTDVTEAAFNSQVSESMKAFVSHNKPFVTASAVVGVTGLKRIIYNAVVKFSGRNLVAFDSHDEAKDWLVQQ